MTYLHVVTKQRCFHHHPKFLTTYLSSIPFPEQGHPPRRPLLICRLSLLPSEKTRDTDHHLFFYPGPFAGQPYQTYEPPPSASSSPRWGCGQICVRRLNTRQCCAPPLPTPVHDVPPGGADIQQHFSYHCIHSDVEKCGKTGSPWVTPLSVLNGWP